MNDHKSSAEIQRELESERSALSESLNRLQDQFAPERLIETVSDQLSRHSGDVTRTVTRAVRENPVAAAAAGVGLVWLIASTRSGDDDDVYRTRSGAAYDRRTTPTARGFGSSDRTFDERMEDVDLRTGGAYVADDMDRDASLWARAKSKAISAKETVGEKAESLRDSLYEGTEKMSDAAAERVARARMHAINAQTSAKEKARRASRKVRAHTSEEPLIYGALALGAGALIGSLLPRTETENRYVGEYRDRAFDEAERIFHEESRKLRAVADAAIDETREVAKDAVDAVTNRVPDGKTAVDTAENKAKSAATRVTDAAKSEAERQNLGKSVS